MDSSYSSKQHNGQLLDLVDLDRYLLSLLSTDLAETVRYVLLTKKTLLDREEKEFWKEPPAEKFPQTTYWQDALAFFSIWLSRGNTPGATALGFGLASQQEQQQQLQQRSSFWRWITRATRTNIGNNSLFRYKIFLYATLRIVLPRLYDHLKSKGLEYANKETSNLQPSQDLLSLKLKSNSSEDEGFPEPNQVQKLAIQRQKLVVRTILHWIDGMILPTARLALLLSCWACTDQGHGGNLSLWMSGLSYQPTRSNVLNTTSKTMIPFFVLYAHRRWFHREAMELLWNKIGRSLLNIHQETIELSSLVRSSFATELRMLQVRWSYKIDKLLQRISWNPTQRTLSMDSHEKEECALCGTNQIVVPYRLVECCGKVACYVCLWERLASKTNSIDKVSCPICHQEISRCEPVCGIETSRH